MFKFESNDTIILEQQQALEAALSSNPKTEATLRKIIRKYIKEARAQVVQGIHFNNGDPRGSRQAVRTMVYKKVLGANINIFNSRKAHGSNNYTPPRKMKPKQRGGNRVKRTARTMDHYAPLDRGFILRWINDGATDRVAGVRGGKLTGNRGSIEARHFFRPLGDRAMGQMRDNLTRAIEEELAAMLPHE